MSSFHPSTPSTQHVIHLQQHVMESLRDAQYQLSASLQFSADHHAAFAAALSKHTLRLQTIREELMYIFAKTKQIKRTLERHGIHLEPVQSPASFEQSSSSSSTNATTTTATATDSESPSSRSSTSASHRRRSTNRSSPGNHNHTHNKSNSTSVGSSPRTAAALSDQPHHRHVSSSPKQSSILDDSIWQEEHVDQAVVSDASNEHIDASSSSSAVPPPPRTSLSSSKAHSPEATVDEVEHDLFGDDEPAFDEDDDNRAPASSQQPSSSWKHHSTSRLFDESGEGKDEGANRWRRSRSANAEQSEVSDDISDDESNDDDDEQQSQPTVFLLSAPVPEPIVYQELSNAVIPEFFSPDGNRRESDSRRS